MKKENYALLVIDMQQVAFDGKITPPIPDGSQLLTSVARLIKTCRSAGMPVIYLQTRARSGQPYAQDAHGWEIHPEVEPQQGEHVVFKVGPSGFENPMLHETLQKIGSDGVIVCGCWSEGCVAITCQSALEVGYDVCLAADGHSTVRETVREAVAVVAEQHEILQQQNVSISDITEIEQSLE